METNMNINLPEDFSTLCSIYQIKPEVIIQSFVNQVSFPYFYSRPHATDRWATFFFLHFLDVEDSKYEVNDELEDEYLRKFTDALKEHFYPNQFDEAKAEEVGRAVMRQWMKAAMADRSKYIMDNL
jgi:hypothetical protein